MRPIAGTERKTCYAARLWGALDPVEVLTEVTSGLTITLVVLLTAGVVLQDGDHPVRVLLVPALGSTLAAGVSAGILNAFEDLHEAGEVGTVWGGVAGISPLACGLVLASVGFVEIVAAFVLEAL
jgi:hypothetical protein